MHRKYIFLVIIFAGVWIFATACAANPPGTGPGANPNHVKDEFAEIELVPQYDAVLPESNSAIEIKFSMAKDWHFYADANTTPNGMNLKIKAEANGIKFSNPILPKPTDYFDKVTNSKQAVYSGNFNCLIPFETGDKEQTSEIKVSITGLSCSQQLCRHASYELAKKIEITKNAKMDNPKFAVAEATAKPPGTGPGAKPVAAAATANQIYRILILAVIAGLLLNVMPCVWPVLPIIVMRLVREAGKSKGKSIVSGIAFAIGIILFFAALAVLSIVLKLGFGIIFQWGDQFRNPTFVIAMALLMVVLALYMFGVLTFSIPVSMNTKKSEGFAGSVGMGFLAAVLSTPCSFGILAFVLAWAQTQPIALATATFLIIGLGMALPYVVLAALPGLLGKIPKPGRWMELFKHATGFILLAIGVKLLEAVNPARIIDILYYAIVLSVCVWMWVVWVTNETPKAKKFIIRIAAVGLAIVFGFLLLSEPKKSLIDWRSYNAAAITEAQKAGRGVLIEFTADWCFSCKILEKTVYSSSEIADLIKQKGVLAVKADTTRYDYPAAKALKEIYNEPAVPVTVLLLPGKEPVKLAGNLIGGKLKEELQSLPGVK